MAKPMKLLPGEMDVDEALVERAVAEIHRVRRVGALHTALAIGEYVVATFFDSDLQLFRVREGDHVSYRRLAAHPDLGMPPSALWTAVNLVSQRDVLGVALTETLSLSHHRVLLSVKDEERKLELAELAAREGFDRDQLAELARERRRGARAGRKPLPRWFKVARRGAVAVGKIGGLVEEAEAGHVSGQRMEELRALVEEADGAWAELKAWLASQEGGSDDARD